MQKTAMLKRRISALAGVRIIAETAVVILAAMFIANSQIQGVRSPIITAFVCILPLSLGIPAFLGAMLTYFITGTVTYSVIQIVSMLAVLASKIFICEILGHKLSPRGRAIVSGASFLICALSITFLTSRDAGAFIVITLQTVLCAVSAYIFSRARLELSEKRRMVFSDFGGICVGAAFVLSVALLCSGQITLFNIGRIFAVFSILAASRRYGAVGGAVCGAAAMLGLAVYSPDFVGVAVFLCIGGLVSGLPEKRGTIMTSLIFLGVNAAGILTLGASHEAARTMADILAASAGFVLIPEKLADRFLGASASSSEKGETAIIASRLEFAANTIHDVRTSVERVADALDKRTAGTDLSTMVCDKICSGCRGSMNCWESNFDRTYSSFKSAENKTLFSGGLSEGELPSELSGCFRRFALAREFSASLKELRASGNARRKINGMRELLCEQFVSLEDILIDISSDVSSVREYDAHLSDELKRCLKQSGAESCRVCVSYDSDGRIVAEGYFTGELTISAEELDDKLFDLTERDFSPPVYTYAGTLTGVFIIEKPKYCIQFGTACRPSQNGSPSGDTVRCFSDGFGTEYAFISDGMGRGKRAALDSVMTSSLLTRLIQSGVSPRAAVRLINSSMQVKSTDESFATLDISRINLHTGMLDMIKLGGCTTFVKSGGRVRCFDTDSLPLGILETPLPETPGVQLYDGDIIVMVSDGVPETEYTSVKKIILDTSETNPELLAEKIIETACPDDEAPHDDISVAVVRIAKNCGTKSAN